jgi:ABC-type antimicrobial peptide transport system permease subunit
MEMFLYHIVLGFIGGVVGFVIFFWFFLLRGKMW